MKREDKNNDQDPVKPDLKHDSMEYSAATDGDDPLDIDNESGLDLEEESITAEELEYLDDDAEQNQAAALNSVEMDSQVDEDNFLTTPDEEEETDVATPDGEEENERG